MMYALKFRHPHPVIRDAWAPFVYAKVRDFFCGNVYPIDATTRLAEAVLRDEIEVLQRSVSLLSAVEKRGKDSRLIDMCIVDVKADIAGELKEVAGSERRIG